MGFFKTKSEVVLLCITLVACDVDGGTSPGTSRNANVASTGSACRQEDASILELKLDRTTRMGDTSIRWVDVSDSRCPLGVKCIRKGEAAVELDIVTGSQAPERVTLVLRPRRNPEDTTVLGLSLRLMSVGPHPISGVTPDEASYSARVYSCRL